MEVSDVKERSESVDESEKSDEEYVDEDEDVMKL